MRQQGLLGRLPRRGDRRHDTATRPRDFFVTCTRKPHLEFASAITGIDKMRVAIDQPGRHQPAFAIHPLFRVELRHAVDRAGIDDAPGRLRDRAMRDKAETRPIRTNGREVGIKKQAIAAHQTPAGVVFDLAL